MLEVLKNQSQRGPIEPLKKEDTIVRKAYKETTYDEKGREITQTKYKEVNVTRKVNETAKMVKEITAADKLKELEELISKENKNV